MPDLSLIKDPEALENRYLDKVIVYVESEHDEEAYRRFAGPNVADRLEFKTPKLGGSGWEAVRDRVRDERPSNDNIYGLLDGEAAVHFDGWHGLIGCDRCLFQLTVADAEGLIFLNSHELENLLLLYGDVCGLIVKDVRLSELARHKPEQVREVLVEAARRFFAAAAMKYAAIELRRTGVDTVLFKIGKFLEPEQRSAVSLLCELRQEVKSQGLDWPRLRREIRVIAARLRTRFKEENLEAASQGDHYIRLADGKGLISRLRQIYKSGGPWDGHLVDAVCKAAYAGDFRAQLLEVTKADDGTQ